MVYHLPTVPVYTRFHRRLEVHIARARCGFAHSGNCARDRVHLETEGREHQFGCKARGNRRHWCQSLSVHSHRVAQADHAHTRKKAANARDRRLPNNMLLLIISAINSGCRCILEIWRWSHRPVMLDFPWVENNYMHFNNTGSR